MKLRAGILSAGWIFVTLILITVAGCGSGNGSGSEQGAAQADSAAADGAAVSSEAGGESAMGEDHEHEPGAHGGIIVPIGSDSYHAEAIIDTEGEFRLLMLGKDETRIQEVDLQSVKAYVKVVGDPNATPIELNAVPQEGDSPNKTSQFVGQLPESHRGRQLDITIPNLQIAGERFRIGFTTESETHDEGMPSSIPASEEEQLYLTPGGKYTEADIKANGGVTASKKFKGIRSEHDARPKPGDRLCPISMTKANEKFTWVIDGKPYQFCCPPCVDEYVRTAKERPEELRPPESFIKEGAVSP